MGERTATRFGGAGCDATRAVSFDTFIFTFRAYIGRFLTKRQGQEVRTMALGEPPFQLLYVSQLAPQYKVADVRAIVSAARRRNRERGIAGALLYDGERFAHLIEGPPASVQVLMRRIESDPRHVDVRDCFAAPCPDGRVVGRWVSGYCDVTELDVFRGPTPLIGTRARSAFFDILGRSDVV